MAETSYPFDNADTTETQYSRLFRLLVDSGVWGTPAGTELKAFGDSSGMQVKLPAGFSFVRGHLYYNDAQKTIALNVGGATARIDTLVLRLDPSANSIVAAIVQGTPGAGAPALTQTDAAIYELPIADIAVGVSATTVTAGNVTDRRVFTGSDFGLWTTATRPSSPRMGKAGFNATTLLPEVWDGTTWAGFAPTSLDPTLLSGPVAISKGGTGQTTKAAARNALGVWVSDTDPGGVNDDLWFG